MIGTESQTVPSRDTDRGVQAGGALFLGGGLRLPRLAHRVDSPLLCLPQAPDRSVFDVWLDALSRVGVSSESAWVLTDEDGSSRWSSAGCAATLVLDEATYRGPAGVLRDASDRFEDDGPRVVIEHTRMLESPGLLADLMRSHHSGEHAITVAVNPDGSFSGILIADPTAIAVIPRIGFMDIKEQWLPAVHASGFRVERVPLGGWSRSTRTLDGYIAALSAMGAFKTNDRVSVIGMERSVLDPCRYGDAMVCAGSIVDPTAAIARSVIGPDASVGPGAVVARSLVSRGAVIPANARIVDSVVGPADSAAAGRV